MDCVSCRHNLPLNLFDSIACDLASPFHPGSWSLATLPRGGRTLSDSTLPASHKHLFRDHDDGRLRSSRQGYTITFLPLRRPDCAPNGLLPKIAAVGQGKVKTFIQIPHGDHSPFRAARSSLRATNWKCLSNGTPERYSPFSPCVCHALRTSVAHASSGPFESAAG